MQKKKLINIHFYESKMFSNANDSFFFLLGSSGNRGNQIHVIPVSEPILFG